MLSKGERQRMGRWQMRGRCFIQIGEQWKLDFTSYRNQSYRSLREIISIIMTKIQNLSQLAEKNFYTGRKYKSWLIKKSGQKITDILISN